ncbi:hypothetical protein FHT40_005001 [Mycolicibacterium sp. BK556]|uniref:hypothetical protein n=1 Tax=unclassified Mycolicibacterium TaxID=2636767 RepID=UPI00160AFE6E|nr:MULTISPECIES: hypothetical protein [unclassified Mycolicibacterium]MBB3605317.1 hypothetical protein [Mycolicibacterium sp. BK556]MBB3635513.1 hypothetical protein [Mycolicibacterium sp. BK607]
MGQQGRYSIGRVGALAVALGIGGFILAVPAVSDADTGSGNSGKTTSSAGKPAPRNSTKPAARAPKATVKPSGTLAAANRVPAARLSSGTDPLAPVTEPLSFAALAVTRRDKVRGTVTSTTTPSASDTGAAPLAAGATASPALNTAVRNFIDTHLPGWTSIADELAPIVADGIQDLLSNGAVSAEVQRLVTNTAIRQFVSTKISTALTYYLGAPEAVGVVVGNAAVNLATTVLGNTGVQGALDVLANAVRPDSAQATAISTALNGGDVAPLTSYLKSVVANSSDEIATFLSTPAVGAALAAGASQAVIDLTSGPTIPTWLGGVAGGWVSQALGGGAAAEGLGSAVGNAVQGLLSNTNAMQGLAAAAGIAVTNILGTPGVPAALADFITQFGTSYLGGTNWIDALDVAWQGLVSDSAFLSSLGPATGAVVYSLATNSGVVSALGSTVTGLVNDIAGNAAVRALIGEVLGPEYGPTLVSTLADPTSAAQLAATAGAVVTGFLSQAGVAAALSAAADQIVTDLLAGASLTDAIMTAFGGLQADAAVVAAFNATVPDALKGVLKAPAVRGVISEVAQGVVADLLDKTPLNFVATSGVTKAAVDALVANPAAQNLIGNLAGEILNGTPPEELVNTVVAEVVKSQALQIALGQALGQGFGALFGDNPVSFAIGQLAGVGAAAFLVFAFGAANLFGLTGSLTAAAAPSGSSYLLIPVSVA